MQNPMINSKGLAKGIRRSPKMCQGIHDEKQSQHSESTGICCISWTDGDGWLKFPRAHGHAIKSRMTWRKKQTNHRKINDHSKIRLEKDHSLLQKMMMYIGNIWKDKNRHSKDDHPPKQPVLKWMDVWWNDHFPGKGLDHHPIETTIK